MSVSSVINARLERFFRWLGAKVGRHPWAFILCSVSVALVAGSGITKLENESDYFTLWYPRKSQAWTDWQYQKRRFGPEKRVQSLVAEARGGGNVLEKAALLDVLRLHTALTNGTRWEKVCERAWDGGPCKALSLLNLWRNDPARLAADDDVLGTLSATPLFDPILEEYASLDALAAKAPFDGSRVAFASAIQIVYYVDDSLNSDEASRDTLDFEEDFVDACYDDFESDRVEVYCAASSSYKQLSDGEIERNSIFVSSAMVVMVCYVSILLFKRDAVKSRALLGGTIVLTVGLALLFALGICTASRAPRHAFFTNTPSSPPQAAGSACRLASSPSCRSSSFWASASTT